MKKIALAASALALVTASLQPVAARTTDPSPTCSDVLEIEVHGQHVVYDYVAGFGHDALEWPPTGGVVGRAVAENGGAALPGGPGPGFHFPNDVPPGASFCVDAASGGRGR